MSLATRCVSCGTVFRVVQDQLKVSEGWVRCGRCEHVFNALDSLFDLENQAPPPWPPPAAPTSRPGGLAPPAQEDSAQAPAVVVDTETAAASGPASSASLLGTPSTPAPAGSADDRPRRLFGWSRPAPLDESGAAGTSHAATEIPTEILSQATEVPTEVPTEITTEILAEGMPPADVSASEMDMEAEDLKPAPIESATPEFLRRAQAAERWKRPRTRIGLGLLALLLSALLLAQVSVHERDWIAARWPQSEPELREMCAILGCELDALRRIDSLTVESSGLTAMSNGGVHRFNVTLRNHDALPVKLPAVELTLTDTRGQVLARKVLVGTDFGVARKTVDAGRELPLEVLLETGDRRVAGYSIEIFYP